MQIFDELTEGFTTEIGKVSVNRCLIVDVSPSQNENEMKSIWKESIWLMEKSVVNLLLLYLNGFKGLKTHFRSQEALL